MRALIQRGITYSRTSPCSSGKDKANDFKENDRLAQTGRDTGSHCRCDTLPENTMYSRRPAGCLRPQFPAHRPENRSPGSLTTQHARFLGCSDRRPPGERLLAATPCRLRLNDKPHTLSHRQPQRAIGPVEPGRRGRQPCRPFQLDDPQRGRRNVRLAGPNQIFVRRTHCGHGGSRPKMLGPRAISSVRPLGPA